MTADNGKLTKQVTGHFFDLTKIGVGDVVEFTGNADHLADEGVPIRKAGIVKRASEYELTITTANKVRPYPFDDPIHDEVISAEFSEEADVRMLFRAFYNAGEGKEYGNPELFHLRESVSEITCFECDGEVGEDFVMVSGTPYCALCAKKVREWEAETFGEN